MNVGKISQFCVDNPVCMQGEILILIHQSALLITRLGSITSNMVTDFYSDLSNLLLACFLGFQRQILPVFAQSQS